MNQSFKRILGYAKEYKNTMIFSVIIAIFSVVLGIIPYFIVHRIIMEFINNAATLSNIGLLAFIGGVGLFFKTILYGFSTILSHKAAYQILFNIRKAVVDKLSRLSMGYITSNSSGKFKKVLVEDIEQMEYPLAHVIPEFTSNLILPISILIYLFILDWRMALVSLISVFIGYTVFSFMLVGHKEMMNKYNTSIENMNSTVVEYIKGIEVIKAYNQTTSSFTKYTGSIKEYLNTTITWYRHCWPYMSAYYVITPASIAIVLPVGALFYINNTIELSVYILCIILSMGLVGPIIKLTEFMDNVFIIKQTEQRVHEMLSVKELEQIDEPIDRFNNYNIDFKNVKFSYDKIQVLKGVTFEARENTTTAIVGPSGSGKSTIAKLIARFWDVDSGEVLIGGINIKKIPINQLVENISFVSQDIFLFNMSIKENIRIGKPDASDDEILKAVKLAQCDEFIKRFEEGYDTNVGDAGDRLSGGEKQRISIARAIIKNAPIVLLDEATSFADPENEDKIQNAINKLTQGKTLIIIAHRLSTISNADNIVLINKGKIEEQGKHNELLDKCKLYKKMWTAHMDAIDWGMKKEVETEC